MFSFKRSTFYSKVVIVDTVIPVLNGVPDDCDTLEFGCNDDNMKPEDTFFDDVIGHIEDVLVDQEFQDMQKSFMEKYWQEFHEGEENKLCYMDIFKEYGDLIENHIENYLANRIPHFSMQNFIEELQLKKELWKIC
ncbi:ADP-ribosylation factor-like protein 2-binding protein isoform X6 [Schistocerca serialis cubense]|uniref:ADP-ribosylation factor-like protein 2-binding protein isoform X6 n=1 Tax=Schistocerca serialis cubense TaxID=2023355 RepID=UPI00214E5E87|nr:ADP-ribosylation factor-like protein 2-binding protein isoform X6 [Schistocerca serialis cubense]